MVFIWSERSGRCRPPSKMSQSSPPKKCRKASTTKRCHKAAPPKKCRKEGRLKICSKCSPPQKCCEAALQKVPCYVKVAPQKMSKQPPSKNITKQPPQNALPQPSLRVRSRPLDIKTITDNNQWILR